MIWRCDLTHQAAFYNDKVNQAFSTVIASGRYVLGEQVAAFEQEYAQYLGISHCTAVASGTDALVLALKVIGIKPGAEVITTPFTAIPTISAIIEAGGKPVFVDVEKDSCLLDVEKIAGAVTTSTAAIIPVHLFCQMVDVEQLRQLLPISIPIIEDACQAHGCRLRGKMAGTLGELGVFSFYPTKNLGAYGDGGCIVSDNPDYDTKLRLLRNYGKLTPDNIVLNGINSRLDEIQAAVLRVKLFDLERNNERRRQLVDLYQELLRDLPIELLKIKENSVANYHVFVVKIKQNRDDLRKYLFNNGIQTDVFYPYPHHLQPAYEWLGYKPGDFPVAEQLGREVLALPLYPELSEDTIQFISETITNFFRRSK